MHCLTLLTVPCADQFSFLKLKNPFFRDNSDTPPLANTPKQSLFWLTKVFLPLFWNTTAKNTLSLQSTNAYTIRLTKTRYEISPFDIAAASSYVCSPQGTVILKDFYQENSPMTTSMNAKLWPAAGDPGGIQGNLEFQIATGFFFNFWG